MLGNYLTVPCGMINILYVLVIVYANFNPPLSIVSSFDGTMELCGLFLLVLFISTEGKLLCLLEFSLPPDFSLRSYTITNFFVNIVDSLKFYCT